MDPEIEKHLTDCATIRDDLSKCAKSRTIARTSIAICHGVIDLIEENKRMEMQIVALRALVEPEEPTKKCSEKDCIAPVIPGQDLCENCFDVEAWKAR